MFFSWNWEQCWLQWPKNNNTFPHCWQCLAFGDFEIAISGLPLFPAWKYLSNGKIIHDHLWRNEGFVLQRKPLFWTELPDNKFALIKENNEQIFRARSTNDRQKSDRTIGAWWIQKLLWHLIPVFNFFFVRVTTHLHDITLASLPISNFNFNFSFRPDSNERKFKDDAMKKNKLKNTAEECSWDDHPNSRVLDMRGHPSCKSRGHCWVQVLCAQFLMSTDPPTALIFLLCIRQLKLLSCVVQIKLTQ